MADKARPGAVASVRTSGQLHNALAAPPINRPNRGDVQPAQADLFTEVHDPTKLDGPSLSSPTPGQATQAGTSTQFPAASNALDAGRVSPQFQSWVDSARDNRIEDVTNRRGIKLMGKIDRCGPCPVCGGDDRFSINTRKQCWNCRGCGKGGDVIDLVKHLDNCEFLEACEILTGEPPPAKPNGKDRAAAAPKKVVAERFDYLDEGGTLLFQVERVEFQNLDGSFVLMVDGKRKKTFWQRRPDPDLPGEWIYNLDGVRPVPYRLGELLEALSNKNVILVVEGERKVNLLRGWNVPATCCAGGSGKWRPEHSAFLKGVDVVILPDNDDAGRKHVEVVATSLQCIAASVRVLELPGLRPRGDVDDWAAAGHMADELRRLIETTARPWTSRHAMEQRKAKRGKAGPDMVFPRQSAESGLDEMNEQFAVVQIGGKTRVVSLEADAVHPGGKIPVYQTLADFRAFQEKWRIEWTNDKNETESVGRGRWWLRHPGRRQYRGVIYASNAKPAGMLNLWTGFACEARAGDCGLYLDHIRKNICAGNSEHAEYLLNWMALAVQRPELQGEVAVVQRGKEGTGKGVFAKQFGRLFGVHFLHISNGAHLTGKFNAHLQQCSVLFPDEAFFAGDRSHEGVLKALITEETLMIEPKGINAFAARNHLHIIMASNSDWVVPAGGDARRFFVLDVSDAHKQETAYFGAIENQMDSGGREALLAMLLERDLSGFDVRHVPHTAALDDQKGFTRSGIDRLVEKCASESVLPSGHCRYPNIAVTSGEGEGRGFYVAARNISPDLRHLGSIAISNVLKKQWGCRPWHSGGERGIEFPALRTLRDLFDKKHGSQEWGEGSADWQLRDDTNVV